MCCGKGCTPHRPLVNADRDAVVAGPVTSVTPTDVAQEPRPVGVETRKLPRWRFSTVRKLTDVQESYDGAHTNVPRPELVQVEQMQGVVPTPATAIRRTATRDTGAGGCS